MKRGLGTLVFVPQPPQPVCDPTTMKAPSHGQMCTDANGDTWKYDQFINMWLRIAGPGTVAPTTTTTPAPTATTNWFSQQMIAGIPNWVLLGAAAAALMFLGEKR